jgi:hypothetical protein
MDFPAWLEGTKKCHESLESVSSSLPLYAITDREENFRFLSPEWFWNEIQSAAFADPFFILKVLVKLQIPLGP